MDVDKTAKGQFTMNFPDAESAKRAGPVLEEGIKYLDGYIKVIAESDRDPLGNFVGTWLRATLKKRK